MIEEKELNENILKNSINKCLDIDFKMKLKSNMSNLSILDSSTKIYEVIKEITK